MTRRGVLLWAAAAAGLAATPVWAIDAAAVLRQLNHDGDQTLEMPEVIDASAKLFRALNKDGDLTLERSETAGRLTDADWSAVNKDHDQTLELDEWLAVTRRRFMAADGNHDGKLSAAELDSPAGQALVRMMLE